MATPVYLSGNAGSGKTAISLSLALKLKEKGYSVSYFKPQGFQQLPSKREDDDLHLMKKALSLNVPGETISPVLLTPSYLSSNSTVESNELLEKLDAAFQELSANSDLLLIEGSITPFIGSCYFMDDYSLSRRWNAAMVQIIKADDDFELDNTLIYKKYAELSGVSLLGCIFNNVSPEQWEITQTLYKSMIENTPVMGIMPRRPEISTPTVHEFYKDLGGEVLAAGEHMNRKVENVVIGTMTVESALRHLRRSAKKAVITGGDRSDMALTALETSTSVIILTGGLYPDVKVLSRAEEKEVPVILVHYDTYTTVENLQHVYRSIHPDNKEAFDILRKDTEAYLDLTPVYNYIQDNSSK